MAHSSRVYQGGVAKDQGGQVFQRRAVATVGTVVAVLGLASCSGDDGPSPQAAAQEYLDAWAGGNIPSAAERTSNRQAAEAVLQQVKDVLAATSADLSAGEGSEDGDRATVPFHAEWSLPGVAEPWSYDGELSLLRDDDGWTVEWTPSAVHPELGGDEELVVTRTLPERAPILDSAGQPLFAETEVVIVGIEPRKVGDLNALATTLADTLHISAADIVADVQAAEPEHFVPVITLRRPAYEQVKPVIHPLVGTVFRTDTQVLGRTADFAQPFLGRVGPATKELLEQLGDRYQPGDEIGTSGLQLALNDRLSGSAGVSIGVVPVDSDAEPTPIGEVEPVTGEPVTTTLDSAVQQAADRAAASVPQKAAIVAVRPSTGEVLAVANGPTTGFDMALTAKVPAGSTFKIVTTSALLQAGVVRPDTPVNCPGTVTIGGRQFENVDAFSLGQVPLRTAFAQSCNTTMIEQAQKLPGGQALVDAAAQFGVGTQWELPVTAFGGSLEVPASPVDLAAASIGQGKVLVSPFAMALLVATVPHGSVPAPTLIAGEPTATEPPAAPPENVVTALRDFTRAVVTEGSAAELADVPGEPVAGKTGTAEYGTEDPPRSHAWFVGYQGDLAFAVFVEDGQSSHTTAVPVAETFLRGLGG